MASVKLRGMTWDHRRAVDPLTHATALFRQRHPDIDIEWSARPLSGFEFTPVDKLAEDYDLIILDHPFMGAVAASGSLMPLDDIAGLSDDMFVGPSLRTYRMGGHLWALPVDAATQVAVSRPDLMDALDALPPKDWRALIALGEKARASSMHLAIGLAGVHSLMTFFTLMANLGSPCGTGQTEPFADHSTAREVLGLMRGLLAFCPPQALDWNSIRLHDEMATRDDLVFCPAVYCFATYAEADRSRPLRFHDLPGPTGPSGSTIGGTGLAISARCANMDAALEYVRFCAQLPTQIAFAEHHGQPALHGVWLDETVNARFGGCYRNTLKTMDGCWIRPRYNGYLTFQEKAGDLIEAHLRGDVGESVLLDTLERLHAGR
ncbi:extracellular solute-binding protein [Mesorhizobium sp. VNQ89]|uniref:ABC transporter substrate-binding protein n=1 Tax=Mesorhizobium quangtriensis TaxID=3157709 RepID=UPI0032B71002